MDIYEPVIAEMRAQIEECQRVIVTLEMMQSKGTGGVAAPTTTTQQQGAAFSNDAFFGMTIAEGAKKYLAATKKTATSKIIADALVAGGFKTSAKNFMETVRSIVSRNSSFAFVNGEFGLAEWYPGRKVGVKKERPSNLHLPDSFDEDADVTQEEPSSTAPAQLSPQ